MELNIKMVTKHKKVDSASDLSNRKDLGYSSEVNSCDSGQETRSLHDEIIPIYLDNSHDLESLKAELDNTKLKLEQKISECNQLQGIKEKVEAEIEDLTTSLFEEANKMVYDANLKRHLAEKKLAAAEGKIDALQIEVEALKALVITSTPSNPNSPCHPQLVKKTESSPIRMKLRKNKIVFEREKDKVESPKRVQNTQDLPVEQENNSPMSVFNLRKQVNMDLLEELSTWLGKYLSSASQNNNTNAFCDCSSQLTSNNEKQGTLDDCEMLAKSDYLSRILKEDVSLCLKFNNEDLSRKVSNCIHRNSLSVELATNGEVPTQLCALSETQADCRHRIRLADGEDWFIISQSARNRLTSVCNFFTYLRYIRQGLVKHDAEEIYWKIINLRMEMTFARLGFYREQI